MKDDIMAKSTDRSTLNIDERWVVSVVKTQNVDTALLDQAIADSGLKVGFIVDTLGISRQAFDKKRKGKNAFRLSEVYVLCDLLKINDDSKKNQIFFP